jgi:HK97 family phage prohead protease
MISGEAMPSVEQRNVRVSRHAPRLETRADDSRAIVGYAAVFYRAGDPGSQYELYSDLWERIMPGAFDRALREDDVRGLFNHDPNQLLGRNKAGTLTLSVDATGLRYEIPCDSDSGLHKDVARMLERGDLSGSSFSFSLGEQGNVVWREEGGITIREIHGVRLWDVGPVTFPAYEATSAGLRSGGEASDVRAELEAWRLTRDEAQVERQLRAYRARAREVAADN